MIQQPPAKAFVSCSLRDEDKGFIQYVEGILKQHGIDPSGTVGKYSASPEAVAESMRKNIPAADCVVIIATPRYLRRDLKTGLASLGLSEMVHVEAGIAFAFGKPIIVFVQKGTDIGSFLPGVTQYIELEGHPNELEAKLTLISDLLSNAIQFINRFKAQRTSTRFFRLALAFLAVYGALKLLAKLMRRRRR